MKMQQMLPHRKHCNIQKIEKVACGFFFKWWYLSEKQLITEKYQKFSYQDVQFLVHMLFLDFFFFFWFCILEH